MARVHIEHCMQQMLSEPERELYVEVKRTLSIGALETIGVFRVQRREGRPSVYFCILNLQDLSLSWRRAPLRGFETSMLWSVCLYPP